MYSDEEAEISFFGIDPTPELFDAVETLTASPEFFELYSEGEKIARKNDVLPIITGQPGVMMAYNSRAGITAVITLFRQEPDGVYNRRTSRTHSRVDNAFSVALGWLIAFFAIENWQSVYVKCGVRAVEDAESLLESVFGTELLDDADKFKRMMIVTQYGGSKSITRDELHAKIMKEKIWNLVNDTHDEISSFFPPQYGIELTNPEGSFYASRCYQAIREQTGLDDEELFGEGGAEAVRRYEELLTDERENSYALNDEDGDESWMSGMGDGLARLYDILYYARWAWVNDRMADNIIAYHMEFSKAKEDGVELSHSASTVASDLGIPDMIRCMLAGVPVEDVIA